jgi:hypothetical protein
MLIETAIRKAKNKLIKKADKNGVYENFGEKEQRKIEDDFPVWDMSYDDRRKTLALTNEFFHWCSSYSGRMAS